MVEIKLFPQEKIIGIFRGFREGGMEFHADLILPYRNDFQSIPMHGQFLLVELENPNEAVLGRITSFTSDGKLSSEYGEEFSLRALRDDRPIPEDLREEYLKYRVNIRVLGVVRKVFANKLTFVASHRRLPHVGSKVAFPSDSVLQEIVGHNIEGATIGHFALGEYIYARSNTKTALAKVEDWMQVITPEVLIKFPIQNLVSRRSFIFARAGFGKSNLNKLLFSELYATTPTIRKRDQDIPVGTILFDPDGEYFWPDHNGNPGLCDVPALQDRIVVFTSRQGPSPFYDSFVAGGIKLDIRRMAPSDVVSIALSPERQEQQNVRKLRGLDQKRWEELVDLIDKARNEAPLKEIGKLLQLEGSQEVEALAARANMTAIVRMLHDKSSQLMDMLIYSLAQGKLCIVDISQMRGPQSLILSGLILRRIFERNQEEFTKRDSKTIPTIAVVEEAQSVLNERATAAEPYIAWVKEGRKYDLGALLITQQPGSIPVDILSQGDNWFIFHLLSATDLTNVQRANAHFSQDILSVLLNEPIPGQGVFWSSASQKAYPISLRVLSFRERFIILDPEYSKTPINTFAQQLKTSFQDLLTASQIPTADKSSPEHERSEDNTPDETHDAYAIYKLSVIAALREDTALMTELKQRGKPWGIMVRIIENILPSVLDNREHTAYNMVPDIFTSIFGKRDEAWYTEKRQSSTGQTMTWIRIGKKP